jgi:hypothetical protein
MKVATKVSDTAVVDILLGATSGDSKFQRVDVEVRLDTAAGSKSASPCTASSLGRC